MARLMMSVSSSLLLDAPGTGARTSHPAHASSANDRPTLGFFLFVLTFNVEPPTRDSGSPSSPRPSPTAFRLVVIGLDEEEGPEENERVFFSLASCFFVVFGSFESPEGTSAAGAEGSGSKLRPFALILKKGKKEVIDNPVMGSRPHSPLRFSFSTSHALRCFPSFSTTT